MYYLCGVDEAGVCGVDEGVWRGSTVTIRCIVVYNIV